MNEFLKKFDTIRFVALWSIFRNFLFFWIQIWILNLGRFGTGPNRNRTGPVWPVTGQTGPVPTGKVNPAPTRVTWFCLFWEGLYLKLGLDRPILSLFSTTAFLQAFGPTSSSSEIYLSLSSFSLHCFLNSYKQIDNMNKIFTTQNI